MSVFKRPPSSRRAKFERMTDHEIAELLEQIDGPLDTRALVLDAARRLRRGGGVSISNSRAGGDIIARATSERFPL